LRKVILLLGILSLTSGLVRPISAHAVLVESTPAANSTVSGPDIAFKLRFNVRVDHGRSRLTLMPAKGGTLQQLTIGDEKAPDVLVAKAAGISQGSYVLRWQVLAVDGHITRGDVPFNVRNP
jgi:methionine-rich copper-binding protein CopC